MDLDSDAVRLPSGTTIAMAVVAIYVLGFGIAGRHYQSLATFDGAPIRLRYLAAAAIFLMTVAIPAGTAAALFRIAQNVAVSETRRDPKRRHNLRPGYYSLRVGLADVFGWDVLFKAGGLVVLLSGGLAYAVFQTFISIYPLLYVFDPALLPMPPVQIALHHVLLFAWVFALVVVLFVTRARPKFTLGPISATPSGPESTLRAEPDTQRRMAFVDRLAATATSGIGLLVGAALGFGTVVYPAVTQTLGGGAGQVVNITMSDAPQRQISAVLADRTASFISLVVCDAESDWKVENRRSDGVLAIELIRPIALTPSSIERFCAVGVAAPSG